MGANKAKDPRLEILKPGFEWVFPSKNFNSFSINFLLENTLFMPILTTLVSLTSHQSVLYSDLKVSLLLEMSKISHASNGRAIQISWNIQSSTQVTISRKSEPWKLAINCFYLTSSSSRVTSAMLETNLIEHWPISKRWVLPFPQISASKRF